MLITSLLDINFFFSMHYIDFDIPDVQYVISHNACIKKFVRNLSVISLINTT